MPANFSFWTYWASVAGALSLVGLIASAVLLPWAISRLPANYFVRPPRQRFGQPSLALAGRTLAKNLCGGLLVATGVVLLFVPGQGLLTILLGLILLDIPGKHRWIVKLACRPPIARSLQWLRARSGATPFELVRRAPSTDSGGHGPGDNRT